MSDKEILDEFQAWGITNRRTQRALLALVDPDTADKWIVERWQKLRILDEQRRIVLGKGETLADPVVWSLFASVWEGTVERVSP